MALPICSKKSKIYSWEEIINAIIESRLEGTTLYSYD